MVTAVTSTKRKYILNVIQRENVGLSVDDVSYEFNLLNAFSIMGENGEILTFNELTISALAMLSSNDYLYRVNAFLKKIVNELSNRVELESSAEYDDSLIGFSDTLDMSDEICNLNSDFSVEQNNGVVLISNVGTVNGIVQYIAFPEYDNIDEYVWVTNNTFYLSKSGIYNILVRDNLNGEIICEVGKTIEIN